jgi:TRAP-type C4-dicarboxylate transport system substrate-binding protein
VKFKDYIKEDDRDFGRADWRRKQIHTDWEEKTISTKRRDELLQKEDDKLKEKMKKKGIKVKESIDEAARNKKEARKNLNGLKTKLKKYPDMPDDIKAGINKLIAFYEKELKTYTYDDVFSKDYSK